MKVGVCFISLTNHALECWYHTLTEATDSGGICSFIQRVQLDI